MQNSSACSVTPLPPMAAATHVTLGQGTILRETLSLPQPLLSVEGQRKLSSAPGHAEVQQGSSEPRASSPSSRDTVFLPWSLQICSRFQAGQFENCLNITTLTSKNSTSKAGQYWNDWKEVETWDLRAQNGLGTSHYASDIWPSGYQLDCVTGSRNLHLHFMVLNHYSFYFL